MNRQNNRKSLDRRKIKKHIIPDKAIKFLLSYIVVAQFCKVALDVRSAEVLQVHLGIAVLQALKWQTG